MNWIYTSILVLSLFGLFGCGVDIDYHTITKEELVERRGASALGYAEWYALFGEIFKCNIYTLDPSQYIPEQCFEMVLEHEERHCDEGAFHGELDGVTPNCYIK